MAPEEFYSLDDDMFSGWRCIFCGEIIDPVILKNRRTQKPSAIASHVQRRHFEIVAVSDAPASDMPE